MLNHPFDPYGSLSALAVRRVEFTDRILHLIRENSHLPRKRRCVLADRSIRNSCISLSQQ